MRSMLLVALLATPVLADNHEPPVDPPVDPPGQICVDCPPPQGRTTTILRVPRIEEYTVNVKKWVQIDCPEQRFRTVYDDVEVDVPAAPQVTTTSTPQPCVECVPSPGVSVNVPPLMSLDVNAPAPVCTDGSCSTPSLVDVDVNPPRLFGRLFQRLRGKTKGATQ